MVAHRKSAAVVVARKLDGECEDVILYSILDGIDRKFAIEFESAHYSKAIAIESECGRGRKIHRSTLRFY